MGDTPAEPAVALLKPTPSVLAVPLATRAGISGVVASSPNWPALDRQSRPAKPPEIATTPTPPTEPGFSPAPAIATRIPFIQAPRQLALMSPSFCESLITYEPRAREAALAALGDRLRQTPPGTSSAQQSAKTLVRLASSAPYADLRSGVSAILKELEGLGWVVPRHRAPSKFVVATSMSSLESSEVAQVFRTGFLQTGRVPHLNHVLAAHPSYFAIHHQLIDTLVRCPGPLPVPVRCYIAILTAAQYQCKYVVSLIEREFLVNGGDPLWLREGLAAAPEKIRAFVPTLALMCHSPFRVSRAQFEALQRRREDTWSVAELVCAMVVVATFAGLAGIVFGSGINMEVDLPEVPGITTQCDLPPPGAVMAARSSPVVSPSLDSPNGEEPVFNPEVRQATEAIADRLRGRWNADAGMCVPGMEQEEAEAGEDTLERRDDERRGVGSPALSERDQPSRSVSPATAPTAAAVCTELEKYRAIDTLRKHEDFNMRSKEYSMLFVQDFSWDDHGYETVSKFFASAAPTLSKLFSHTYELTYHTFGDSKAELCTDVFRRAIWAYVQRIFGITHDDYNYRDVNELLIRPLKSYIKKVACTPQLITKEDFDNIGLALTPFEKIHVCLLTAEAHKQAMLLRGLQSLTSYMTCSP